MDELRRNIWRCAATMAFVYKADRINQSIKTLLHTQGPRNNTTTIEHNSNTIKNVKYSFYFWYFQRIRQECTCQNALF